MIVTMQEYDYWHLGITIGVTAIFVGILFFLHTSVWVKGGYMGMNRILELHEVDKLIAHVLAEGSFIAVFVICMLEPLVAKYQKFNIPDTTKLVFGLTFAGSGLYVLFGGTVRKWVAHQAKTDDDAHDKK